MSPEPDLQQFISVIENIREHPTLVVALDDDERP